MTETSKKSTSTATNKKASTAKRQRVPLTGNRKRLSIPAHLEDDPNYRYYWFNDTQSRIADALAAGYEFVDSGLLRDQDVGDPDLHNGNSSVDSRVSKRLRDYTIYLMRIPMEFWLEDQQAKAVAADAVDEAIFGSDEKVPNSYGLDVNYRR